MGLISSTFPPVPSTPTPTITRRDGTGNTHSKSGSSINGVPKKPETFDPRRGLWATTEKEEEREVYLRPSKTQEERYALEWYNFMGKVVGKVMYEGILVDVVFARFFLARWLSSSASKEKKGVKSVRMTLLDDLRSLDEKVWRGLVFLKRLPPAEVEPLGLRFCVDVEEFGETTTYDLIPNGSQVAVTRDNQMQYIHLLSHFKLIKQLRLQSTSFFNGISELIQPRWVRMFTPRELSNLISGVGGGDAKVDIGDLYECLNGGKINCPPT
ncbi:ubiquitin-protein ligase (E3) [Marasmius tenuissimus]|nr:ubiquitin-protein ligase (E3) [Marasmius tenuissimus]